ncbi:hypothetical protein ACP4OV_002239 [Aristida adscensionis]
MATDFHSITWKLLFIALAIAAIFSAAHAEEELQQPPITLAPPPPDHGQPGACEPKGLSKPECDSWCGGEDAGYIKGDQCCCNG